MEFAEGMAEASRLNDTMAESNEAAAFWAEGMPNAPFEDDTYSGADGQPQAARLYRGAGGPVVLYIHGGGWVGGSIAMNERACRALAHHAQADVVSISYRLAPDHPFPAGLEDCRAALRHYRPQFGNDPIILAGASAGANLALALALDEEVAGLLLFYGLFGADLTTSSYDTYAEGFGLDRARVAEILDLYDPTGQRATDPRVCPLTAADDMLAKLPPSLLLAAEHDVLRDDSVKLARRLTALGRPHDLHIEPGVTHGFINRGRLVPAADRCLEQAAAFLTALNEKIAK